MLQVYDYHGRKRPMIGYLRGSESERLWHRQYSKTLRVAILKSATVDYSKLDPNEPVELERNSMTFAIDEHDGLPPYRPYCWLIEGAELLLDAYRMGLIEARP